MWGRRSHYGGTTQIEFVRERIFAAENLAREVNCLHLLPVITLKMQILENSATKHLKYRVRL